MMGRGFHYALAALGAPGPGHLAEILTQDLHANMGQLGLDTPSRAASRLLRQDQRAKEPN